MPICRQPAAGHCATLALQTARFHWIRKAYEYVDGLDKPEPLFLNENDIARTPCLTRTALGDDAIC
jgi:glyoxylate utilization-related uncharacterized protein